MHDVSTDTRTRPSEAAADAKAVIDHASHGTPLDPDVTRRVHERAQAIHKRLPVTNIAVDLQECPTLFDYGDLIDRAMELSSQFRIDVLDC